MKSSGDKTTKEIINPYITGTAIASGILLISAFFIFAISEEASHVSFSENLKIFLRQPLAWIAVVSAIAMTFVARHISSKMAADITRLKNITEKCDEKMESVYKFSRSLLNDDFNVTFALKEETDRLSETLVMLRDKLTLNRQQEQKRREEESIRNWLAESESHFSEILRNNLNNPEELSFQVLKDLTRNINAVQGGFYILDDGDENNKFFNLLSFFAFDRKKFADRRIKWGDGLIGTCALEKKTILLNNIPETYIKVTSGLGETKPGFLLLEPMIYENKVYGVLEFASLSAFQTQHINLVNKVAASIGTTLASVKTSLRNAKLLEDSKEQANILASQEEEMRQNMEELKATQEEAARQSRQLISLENSINKVLIRADLDNSGRIIWANKAFYEKLHFNSARETENRNIKDFICARDKDEFAVRWDSVNSDGGYYEGRLGLVSGHGAELWFLAAITSVRDDDGNIDKIILLALDMTECQQQILTLLPFRGSVERTGIKVEADIHGTITGANENFFKITGISKKDIDTVLLNDLVDPVDAESFALKWESAVKGNEVDATFRIVSRSGDGKWLDVWIAGICDINKQVYKVILAGKDITDAKATEKGFRALSENIQKYEKLLYETERESLRKIRDVRTELAEKHREATAISMKYEKLLDECPFGVVISNAANRITFFNKASENLWKVKRSDFLEQNIDIIFRTASAENDNLLKFYTSAGITKGIEDFNKITIADSTGKQKNCNVSVTRAEAGKENATIAFVREL